MEPFVVLFIGMIVFAIVSHKSENPTCKKCNIKMDMVDEDDPLEPKIGELGGIKFKLNLSRGIPHKVKRKFRCKECNRTLTKKMTKRDDL